jgi:hypothetical protein
VTPNLLIIHDSAVQCGEYAAKPVCQLEDSSLVHKK